MPSSVIRSIVVCLLLTGVLVAGSAFAATDVGSINFLLGRKSLTKDWYLGPPIVDATGQVVEPGRAGQPSLGIELTWGREGWPAMVALDVLHSYDDGIIHVPAFFTIPAYDVRPRASTLEIGLGARRAWNVLGLTPYVGAGGSWVRANFVVEVIDPNAGQFGVLTASARGAATAFGFWAGGGVYRRLGPRLQIGLAGRYSKATLPASGFFQDGPSPAPAVGTPELDGGGRHVNLVVGWSFPSRK
ncbi:MAG: hypothetical protein ACRENJ_09955 [Candidatus Eiseniibacteriota bacterium]